MLMPYLNYKENCVYFLDKNTANFLINNKIADNFLPDFDNNKENNKKEFFNKMIKIKYEE